MTSEVQNTDRATVRQADLAPHLGVVVWTLIEQRKRGTLRAARDQSGRVEFDRAEVEATIGARLADGPFFSVADAAALLGLTPAMVYKRIKRGAIGVARIGDRTVRVSRAEIERVLAEAAAMVARRQRNAARTSSTSSPVIGAEGISP